MFKKDIKNIDELEKQVKNIRHNIIRMITKAGSGHPGGALGLAEVFGALYLAKLLRYNPKDSADSNRDILVISNGHVCPVLYATLAEAGLIDYSELDTFRQFGSRLQGHPERKMLPWVEASSGPLGEGISQAAGMAYALKYLSPKNDRLVIAIVGDGEMNEGECWEAIMFANKYHLNNLIIMIDHNNIQLSGNTNDVMPLPDLDEALYGLTDNILEKMECYDLKELIQELGDHFNDMRQGDFDGPLIIFLDTKSGKDVSFMEGDYRWHGKAPSAKQAEQAYRDIESAVREKDTDDLLDDIEEEGEYYYDE